MNRTLARATVANSLYRGKGVAAREMARPLPSPRYFTRPFCVKELRWAKLYGCALLGVVEQDSRHSPADLGLEARRAPADLAHVLADVEFLEYQRRDYLEAAMVGRASCSPLPSMVDDCPG